MSRRGVLKGTAAAAVTALARYTVRAATVRRRRPSTALADLNDVLLRHETDRFCTAALMRLRQRDGSWTVAVSAGGHPLPVLLAGDRDPVPFGRSGSLLGVMPEPSLHDSELVLRPADALVLYTDGVTEGRRNGEFYGEERLTATLSRHRGGAAALTEGTLAEVMEFQGGLPRDDIAVVAVTVPG